VRHFPHSAIRKLRWLLLIIVTATTGLFTTACGTPGATVGMANTNNTAPPATTALTTSSVPILLFIGTGTSSGDVSAVETLLGSLKLSYHTATSSQLNSMSETQIRAYKLLIVPGGNSITIGKYLSKTATTNIQNAVQQGGMHYLGFCAGGFFGGYSIYNGLNLTSGVWFNFYADYFKGIHKAAVEISRPGQSTLDIYWQDGPQLSGWGSAVGKYSDGTPAIVEGKSGLGWVILTGIHPEAPLSWRTGMSFTTTVSTDIAYAGTLVKAALYGTALPHY